MRGARTHPASRRLTSALATLEARHGRGALPEIADGAMIGRRAVFDARAGRAVAIDTHMALCAALGLDPATGRPRPRPAAAPGPFLWWYFGAAVATKLHMDGLTVRAAAPAIGVSSATISRVTSGRAVSVDSVLRLCAWLGLPPEGYCETRSTGNVGCNTLKTPETTS